VLLCYLLGGGAAVIATFITQASIPEGYFLGITAALAGVYGIWRLERAPFQ
jgi:hypothetical protein